MKHFVLDQDDDRVPVLRMFDRFGRLTEQSALAFEIEVRLYNGSVADFTLEREHSVHTLQ